MPSSVKVVYNHFDTVAEKLHQAAKDIVSETAESVEKRGEANAPVATSFLQHSGYVVTKAQSGYSAAVSAAASANGAAMMLDAEPAPPNDTTAYVVFGAEYAIYVHEGTSRMGARPFLAQAAVDEQGAWARRWQDIEKRIKV